MENGLQPGAQIYPVFLQHQCAVAYTFIPHMTAAGIALWSPAEETEGHGWLQLVHGRTDLNLHLLNSLRGFPETPPGRRWGGVLGGDGAGLALGSLAALQAYLTSRVPRWEPRAKALLPLILAGTHRRPIPRDKGPPSCLSVFATPAPGRHYIYAGFLVLQRFH